VIPIIVVQARNGRRFDRLQIFKRKEPVSVRLFRALQLRDRDRLHDRKTALLTVVEVTNNFLAVQAMKEFPSGVAEPKKRRAVFGR